MAATAKGPQKMQLDWNVDREIYNNFMRTVQQRGYAPQVIVEKLMKKYTEGQVQV